MAKGEPFWVGNSALCVEFSVFLHVLIKGLLYFQLIQSKPDNEKISFKKDRIPDCSSDAGSYGQCSGGRQCP